MLRTTREQRRSIHLKWRQADQGLSYRSFRNLAIPVFAGDGDEFALFAVDSGGEERAGALSRGPFWSCLWSRFAGLDGT